MKRNGFYISRIAAAFLSLLIIFAASGAWSTSYCCEQCAQRGLSVFITGHCAQAGEQEGCCSGQLPAKKVSGCGSQEQCRFEWRTAPVDLSSPVATGFQFVPFLCLSLFPEITGLRPYCLSVRDVRIAAFDPPPLGGRRILERHSVFLI